MENMAIYRSVELDEDFIFTEILPKLPVKSLMRFKCVSKSWLDRISGESVFIESHLNQQPRDLHAIVLGRYQASPRQKMTLHSFDGGLKTTEVDVSHVTVGHGPVEIVGSCNGLVCLLSVLPGESQTPNYLLLWNPATRQVRKLPNAPRAYTRSFGFGFDSTSGEYKVVYLGSKIFKDMPALSARVLVKSRNEWRAPKWNRGIYGRPDMVSRKGTVEANGALHWLAFRKSREISIVVSFGLSDEGLRRAPGPASGHSNKWRLCKWGDSLAAVKPAREGGGFDFLVATGAVASPSCRDMGWMKLLKIEGHELSRSVEGAVAGNGVSEET